MLPAPPGPFRPGFFRSPLRGPWLTSALGSILLVLITIVATTGFLSHAAYMPDLRGNAIVPADRDLPLATFFDWPTGPSWLYALTQGLHTNVGLVAIPFLLAKLWSVIPRLFAFPPVTSPAQAIERLSIALLVSSAVFELATGVMNAQYWYPFKFNFVVAHYYGAIVFVASLVLHVIVKLPVIARAYRQRGRAEAAARQPREHQARAGGRARRARDDRTRPRRRSRAAGCSPSPAPERACCCWATSGSRSAGRCASSRSSRRGASDFPVNKTARAAGVTRGDGRAGLRAEAARRRHRGLASRARSCSRCRSAPRGCRSRASRAGRRRRSGPACSSPCWPSARARPGASEVLVESLQPAGVLRRASLSGAQIAADDALLALKVNGADLSMDHGYPARDHRPRAAGRAQHQVGRPDDLPEGVMTFRARYGASPIHLLAHLALLPLVAWALLTVLDFRAASNVVLWLVGAVILHDLVLLPAYSALDRVARVAVPGAINYVRVPGGLSLLMPARLLGHDPRQGRGRLRARQRAGVRGLRRRAGCC